MEKKYKTLLKQKDAKLPKAEIIEKLLIYSKFWSQLTLSDFMDSGLTTSKVN